MNNAKLEELIRALRPCRIAIIGDVMLDRYVKGNTDRISPEAPIPVLDVIGEYQMLGGAANVTMKVAELGSIACIVGLVGVDPPGAELRALLAGQPAITDSLIADPGRFTTVKTRFVAHNQQLLRVDRELRRPPTGETLEQLVQAARDAVVAAEAIILVDYGKGVLCSEVIRAALESVRSTRIPVVVDPYGLDYTRYAGTTLLTPNLKELEVASRQQITDLTNLEEAAHSLVHQTDAAIAVTRGADGISLFHRQGSDDARTHTWLPTSAVAVHDVTGAGDAVTTIIAIALASGIEMADACILANLAGKIVVGQFGVGTLSIAHLLAESHRGSMDSGPKVVDIDHACQGAHKIRESGGRVVFTNGCFDILHQGHMNLLRFARAQGDLLILGLNSDASMKRFKGPNRPYVPEAQRAFMLSLYPFVDLIVLFEGDTPIDMIEAIRPDVLVKGGDYTLETIVGRTFVESYGGQVVICPRTDGLSTTELARKMGAHEIP